MLWSNFKKGFTAGWMPFRRAFKTLVMGALLSSAMMLAGLAMFKIGMVLAAEITWIVGVLILLAASVMGWVKMFRNT